jgi:hypothetical protein
MMMTEGTKEKEAMFQLQGTLGTWSQVYGQGKGALYRGTFR